MYNEYTYIHRYIVGGDVGAAKGYIKAWSNSGGSNS